MIKYIKLYYDSYEKSFGDGFYPLTKKDNSNINEITIGFKFIDDYWQQCTEDSIKGLDGNEHYLLLEILNDNINNCKLIINKNGNII